MWEAITVLVALGLLISFIWFSTRIERSSSVIKLKTHAYYLIDDGWIPVHIEDETGLTLSLSDLYKQSYRDKRKIITLHVR